MRIQLGGIHRRGLVDFTDIAKPAEPPLVQPADTRLVMRTVDGMGLQPCDLQAAIGESTFLLVDVHELFDKFRPRLVVPPVIVQPLSQVIADFDCACHE